MLAAPRSSFGKPERRRVSNAAPRGKARIAKGHRLERIPGLVEAFDAEVCRRHEAEPAVVLRLAHDDDHLLAGVGGPAEESPDQCGAEARALRLGRDGYRGKRETWTVTDGQAREQRVPDDPSGLDGNDR
jgi:hypothetical protein